MQLGLDPNHSSAGSGYGVNPVGLRVRTWGRAASGSGNTWYIDDGSHLPDLQGDPAGQTTGIKVEFVGAGSSPSYSVGSYVYGITGVLGAESINGVPMPVVRVPWPVQGRVIHINKTGGNDSFSGLSWQTAKVSVSAAMNMAVAGDEIWVAAGTYNEHITLKDGVAIYGGFTGNETAREQRDWNTHQTVLDGQLNGTVVTAPVGVTSSACVDGFTIQNGTANNGGGITCSFSSPTISNNTIARCTAANDGGGIYCSSSSPTVSNNTVTGNTARYGGGIGCQASSSPTVFNNALVGNSATLGGGAVYCSDSSPVISYNAITENTANQDGGGVYCDSNSFPTLGNNWITTNVAAGNGGGVLCGDSSSATIQNNMITGNSAVGADGGGGIYCGLVYSDMAIANNTIVANTVPDTYSGGYGSGGGGVFFVGSPIFSNNIVAFNSSGIFSAGTRGASPTLQYNDISGNAHYDYYDDSTGDSSPPGTGNESADPLFADIQYGNYHIEPNSPCRNAGLFTAPGIGATDIDGQPRTQNLTIDSGADESDGFSWYRMTLAQSPAGDTQTGHTVTIIANVFDPVLGANVAGQTVSISLDSGTLQQPAPPNGAITIASSTSGYGSTNNDGNVAFGIGRSAHGVVTASLSITQPSKVKTTETMPLRFIDPPSPYDWPMFMHDPQHTGASSVSDSSSETLTQQWTADVSTASTTCDFAWSPTITVNGQQVSVTHPNPAGGDSSIFEHPYIDSSPVVAGNTVVVGCWDSGNYSSAIGSVKAFNAQTGALIWRASGMGGVASTPCVSGDRVYVGSSDGVLHCLDLDTGSVIWARQTTDRSTTPGNSRIVSSPVVYNGVVYVTNETSKVYAFSADANGTLVSGFPISLPIETHGITGNQRMITGASSPAIAVGGSNTYLLVGCDDGYIYRIDLTTGSILSLNMGGCVESSPSVVGNNAYVGVSIFHGLDLHRLSVEPFADVRDANLCEESRATTALYNGFAYTGVDTGDAFYKLDGSSLSQLAGLSSMGGYYFFVGSAGITANGLVYVGDYDGYFYVLNANYTGSSWTPIVFQPGAGYPICSSPAIAYNVDANHNRWVYVTTRAGALCAFKTVR